MEVHDVHKGESEGAAVADNGGGVNNVNSEQGGIGLLEGAASDIASNYTYDECRGGIDDNDTKQRGVRGGVDSERCRQ